MRTPTLLILLALAASTSSAGCSVYDPSLIQGTEPGFCGFRPPQRPAMSEVGELEIVYALKEVSFDRGPRVGFDLDGVCTDLPDLEASCTPLGTIEPREDGDRGRDNVLAEEIIPAVELDIPDLQETSRQSQEQGVGAIIVRLRDYNGTANDDRVNVMLAVAVFGTTAEAAPDVSFDPAPPYAPSLSDGSQPPLPTWSSGLDVFWAREDNFAGGSADDPFIFDSDAYVSNNMLVVRIPDRSSFVFPGAETGLTARLTGAFLVGRLSDDLGQLQDVTIAGRWPVVDLLATADELGVCAGPRRDVLEALLDNVADVRFDGNDSGTRECDAVSVSIRMQGYQARWPGTTRPAIVPANACASTP